MRALCGLNVITHWLNTSSTLAVQKKFNGNKYVHHTQVQVQVGLPSTPSLPPHSPMSFPLSHIHQLLHHSFAQNSKLTCVIISTTVLFLYPPHWFHGYLYLALIGFVYCLVFFSLIFSFFCFGHVRSTKLATRQKVMHQIQPIRLKCCPKTAESAREHLPWFI